MIAMTALDMFLDGEILKESRDYFAKQTEETSYQPFITQDDKPAIHLNKEIMERYRPEMRKYYFDPTKYDTYLEQLGIEYPTVRKEGN